MFYFSSWTILYPQYIIMGQEMISENAMSIYIRIASFLVPVICGALWWITQRHFDLKERVKVNEINLAANSQNDKKQEDNMNKIFDAIEQLNRTVASRL